MADPNHAALDVRIGGLEDASRRTQECVDAIGERVGKVEIDLAGLKGRLWGVAAVLAVVIPIVTKLIDRALP